MSLSRSPPRGAFIVTEKRNEGMRDPEQWATIRLAELFGANFDEHQKELDELVARVDKNLVNAQAMEDRLAAMPDIRTEGEAPALEELEEAIAEAQREQEREWVAAIQRRQLQEEEREKKRRQNRRRIFTPTTATKQEKEQENDDDYGMEF